MIAIADTWHPQAVGDLLIRIGVPVGCALIGGYFLMRILVAYFESKKK